MMAAEDKVGENPKPCFHHLWIELPATEAQQKDTGHATYEICPKCNSVRWPEAV